jgi:hypothetical protein
MKILVCGGRDFGNYHRARDVLYAYLDRVTCIIEGGARGADALGRMFANDYNIPLKTFPANWERYGRSAGHIRNQQMLDEGHPDLVIAFPGGRGTANMIERAKKAGVETIIIE